ncbi:hypothetical protein [Streptomyces neyagawaensis]|uniref:hypothetical protein n=1 Tax=Streptomyces neyagawaensis TaxID=42238 RepID=UPI0006E25B29|nr:hypothetical protein [Streptomyces neyagawaensis]MCL6735238.1 hypothetical protein [Streptomyces neyagawaensis]MDE1683862.1 hypothetical protein [Streptomyces neyagawaensis]
MRLGKALATGVAEERPQSYKTVEATDRAAGRRRPADEARRTSPAAAPAPETSVADVPVAEAPVAEVSAVR